MLCINGQPYTRREIINNKANSQSITKQKGSDIAINISDPLVMNDKLHLLLFDLNIALVGYGIAVIKVYT